MRVTRRRLLVAAAGAVGVVGATGALVEADVLPGRGRAHRLLGLDDVDLPDVETGRLRRGSLDGSRWVVCDPPGGGRDLPVVLAFHGAIYDTEDLVSTFGVDRFLAASGQRFAVAAVDDLTLTMTRLRPLLDEMGYNVARPGLLGWSRGGYVALGEAIALRAEVAGLAVASPALSGGVDDPAGADRLRGLPVRIDCGRQDPLYGAVTAFADRLADLDVDATVSIEDGAHDVPYWTRALPGQLTWLGGVVG